MSRGRHWGDIFKAIVAFLCFLFPAAMAIRSVALAGMAAGQDDRIGVVINMIAVLPWGVLAGILFVRIYLRGIASHLVDSLLAPRRFLKRPAPLISPILALLKQERYDEALERLNALIETDPDVPRLWVMRFDLMSQEFNDPEEALHTAETYLVRPKRICSEDNAKLVLRYAELARKLQRGNDALLMLTAELHRSGTGYSRAERRLLENMKKSLADEAGRG